MNLKLWRVVERFCRGGVVDLAAFGAFAQLVEEDQESAVRKKVSRWSDQELEQLSFLISGTLDTVPDPRNENGFLQCQGLYLTGSEAALIALGKREIPTEARLGLAQSLSGSLPGQIRLVIGSRIVPATWVHGFDWRQWRAALARDGAMFSQPCKTQPRQAPESQAWILPVFVEKAQLTAELAVDVSAAGVSRVAMELAGALAQYLSRVHGQLPSDVSIHPLLAAAHSCWAHAKMIAVHEWAGAVQVRAQADGRTIRLEERPRGSVRARDSRTKEIVATLKADASFPVDGTGIAISLIMDESVF